MKPVLSLSLSLSLSPIVLPCLQRLTYSGMALAVEGRLERFSDVLFAFLTLLKHFGHLQR